MVIVKDAYPFFRLSGFWNPENRTRNYSGNPETLIWTFCRWLPETRDVVSGSPYSTHFLAHRNTSRSGFETTEINGLSKATHIYDQCRCRTTTCPASCRKYINQVMV